MRLEGMQNQYQETDFFCWINRQVITMNQYFFDCGRNALFGWYSSVISIFALFNPLNIFSRNNFGAIYGFLADCLCFMPNAIFTFSVFVLLLGFCHIILPSKVNDTKRKIPIGEMFIRIGAKQLACTLGEMISHYSWKECKAELETCIILNREWLFTAVIHFAIVAQCSRIRIRGVLWVRVLHPKGKMPCHVIDAYLYEWNCNL